MLATFAQLYTLTVFLLFLALDITFLHWWAIFWSVLDIM